MDFVPHPEIALSPDLFDPSVHKTTYKFDYEAIFTDIANGVLPERETFRMLILEDLFFIVHFVMGIEKANHPFVVDRCHDVEAGPRTNTLDVLARFHYKSVIIN